MATLCFSQILQAWSPAPLLGRSSRARVRIVTRTLRTGGDADDSQVSGPNRSPRNPFVTRLGRLLEERRIDLLERFRAIRRNLPLKVFLLLLGFYCANALATVLGQTGDWDVLIAAIMVAVIEGIGYLMYRLPPVTEKFQFFVRLLNYWKAGLSFGLFVDAFKLGS